MKILSVEKIREADAYTIQNEPILSVDLMERAARKLFKWIVKRVDDTHAFKIFAGHGNNGGDGLALARMLAEKGYHIEVYVVQISDKYSTDFEANLQRLQQNGSVKISFLNKKEELPVIDPDELIVDAIFGSGLKNPVDGFAGQVIDHINKSDAVTISVDIPSGLFADRHTDPKKGAIVSADYTVSFQLPKFAFLLPENDPYVGQWQILDIGLSADYINSAETKDFFLEKRDIIPLLRKRKKFSHKGTFGHALLIAGGYGKFGAAVLSSRACLRSGVGLLHTHIAKSGTAILQTACPETMLSIDRDENYLSEIPDLGAYTTVGIGPGIGKELATQKALKLLIQNYQKPMIFDADALNILAENKTWLAFIPKGSILTPHPKEFERLAGKWKDDFEKIKMQREFAIKYGIYLVLKGAHTSTCFPDGKLYFNSTGNPGMATAGSGDVLTGLLTGLLAQGYAPAVAAVLGVFIHGLAGDMAAKKHGMDAMISGDIIEKIGKAFKQLSADY